MAGSWSAREIRSWGKRNRPVSEIGTPGLFSAEKLAGFQSDIIAGLFGQAEKQMIAAMKKQARAEKERVLATQRQRSGGIEPLLAQFVDGREDPSLQTVQADSTIVLQWHYLPEVAKRTFIALVERSPRESGDYIEGLITFLDGVPNSLDAITINTQEVQIVASVAYARRLEVGKDAHGEPWVKQVAPHIVEETAIVAKRKFGELAKVTYNYVELQNAYQLKNPANWRRRHGVLNTEVQYPAIIIVPT